MPKLTRESIEREIAFDEVNFNPPNRLKAKIRKVGKEGAEPMRIAIALSKARARGAKIPR